MESNFEIGNPNIPTPNGLPNNDNIKNLIAIGIGVMAGIVIYQLFKKKDEKQNSKPTD
jgi:glycopeptide antibiotics resistance protein|tara:strand:- start:256 stop:429 length:174 start_codon:yes stop_codon:yes gene_type:complete